MRPGRSAREEAGGQIYSDHAIPGFIGFRGEHFARAATGIVDEHVQGAIRRDRFRDSSFDGCAIVNIAREKSDFAALRADCILDGAAFLLAAGQDHYFCSFLREAASGGFAYSAVAAGYQGYFILQTAWHGWDSF
jgi:hypothetical protein